MPSLRFQKNFPLLILLWHSPLLPPPRKTNWWRRTRSMTSEWHLGRRHCLLVTSHWSRDFMTSQALGGRRADGFRGSLAPALNLIYRPAWPWETVPRGSVWLFVEMILSVGCRWLSFIFSEVVSLSLEMSGAHGVSLFGFDLFDCLSWTPGNVGLRKRREEPHSFAAIAGFCSSQELWLALLGWHL